jgi:hypothetical protein
VPALLAWPGKQAGGRVEHRSDSLLSLLLAGALVQVASTAQIQLGQWVRLYALARSPAKRRARSLLQNSTTADTSSSLVTASSSNGGFLPLTAVLQRQVAIAAAYAASDASRESVGVVAAARSGTLDAYLYGDNRVDSGTSECGAVCCVQCLCAGTLTGCS